MTTFTLDTDNNITDHVVLRGGRRVVGSDVVVGV